MKLQPIPFEKIRNGSKNIEIRLNDEKRQAINVGDEVEFLLDSDHSQKVRAAVEDLYRFPTFKDLYYSFDPSEYGDETQDGYESMYQFYSPEEEEKYGVLGIKIRIANSL